MCRLYNWGLNIFDPLLQMPQVIPRSCSKLNIRYDWWFEKASQPTGQPISWLYMIFPYNCRWLSGQSDDWLASCLTGLFEPSVVTYIWYTFTQCTRLILLDLQTLADKPSETYLWALFWNVVEYVYNGNWLLLVTRSITRRVLLYARGAVGYWTKYREIKNNTVKKQLYCSMRCLYSDFQIKLS